MCQLHSFSITFKKPYEIILFSTYFFVCLCLYWKFSLNLVCQHHNKLSCILPRKSLKLAKIGRVALVLVSKVRDSQDIRSIVLPLYPWLFSGDSDDESSDSNENSDDSDRKRKHKKKKKKHKKVLVQPHRLSPMYKNNRMFVCL